MQYSIIQVEAQAAHAKKKLPVQQLRPKHVGVLINK